MGHAGRSLLVLVLAILTLGMIAAGPPRAVPLGPAEPDPACAVAIERAGEGVLCMDEAAAEGLGVLPGDRLDADGGVGRMAPERIELFAAPVDVNAASAAELAALPGVGPHLAGRIAAARPFASVDSVRGVPGIGPGRWRALRARLRVGGRAP